MSELETFVQNSARGLYRWERDSGWDKENDGLTDFEEGDAVCIDPFPSSLYGTSQLWAIYATFKAYESEDVARVYIPEWADDETPVWFQEGSGEYLIHEGYLTPA